MTLNLTGVPLAGGATMSICLGFDLLATRPETGGIRADVRVFDVDDPAGPSEVFPAQLPTDTPNAEIADRAIESVSRNIEMQTALWKRMGRRPEVRHVA
jgi:hypothetical protein